MPPSLAGLGCGRVGGEKEDNYDDFPIQTFTVSQPQTALLCVILLVPAAVGSQVTAGREIVTVITSDAVNHGPAPGCCSCDGAVSQYKYSLNQPICQHPAPALNREPDTTPALNPARGRVITAALQL